MKLNQDQQERILMLWDKGADIDDIAGAMDIEEEVIAEFLRAEGFTV